MTAGHISQSTEYIASIMNKNTFIRTLQHLYYFLYSHHVVTESVSKYIIL